MVIDANTALGKRALERLNDDVVIWLTTIDAEGRPQPRPVWFVWYEESIIIYSKPSAAKVKHISRHPQVSMNFDGGRYGDDIVVILGEAVIDASLPPADKISGYVERYADQLPDIGLTAESMAAEYNVAIRVKPTRLRAT